MASHPQKTLQIVPDGVKNNIFTLWMNNSCWALPPKPAELQGPLDAVIHNYCFLLSMNHNVIQTSLSINTWVEGNNHSTDNWTLSLLVEICFSVLDVMRGVSLITNVTNKYWYIIEFMLKNIWKKPVLHWMRSTNCK